VSQLSLLSTRICTEEGPYRYLLGGGNGPSNGKTLLWCMVNPSKANAIIPDPSSTKVGVFTERLGFARWVIVNQYAFRATKYQELKRARAAGFDVVGPKNDEYIQLFAEGSAAAIVVAWGHLADDEVRTRRVLNLLRASGKPIHCLGTTKSGAPRHPLYVGYDTPLVEWRAAS
jgi:hypothetical protein